MDVVIKRMETEEEIRGKAWVHWRTWHEAYPVMVSPAYLDRLTLAKCEEIAFRWRDRDGLLVAKEKDRVVGFVGYGDRGEENPGFGEIFALYVLPERWGQGIGRRLMEAGLAQLAAYPRVCLWVLKENSRARHFYERCGFCPDGEEMYSAAVEAAEIRMTLQRSTGGCHDREG